MESAKLLESYCKFSIENKHIWTQNFSSCRYPSQISKANTDFTLFGSIYVKGLGSKADVKNSSADGRQMGRIQIRNVFLLSAPLNGSDLLAWAIRTVPKFITKCLKLHEDPHPDLMPDSKKSVELRDFLSKHIVNSSTRRLIPFNFNYFQMNGGTDFIVRPTSGLATTIDSGTVTNTNVSPKLENTPDNCQNGVPRVSNVEFIYFESLGHYSVVAVDTFWKEMIKRI